MPPPGNRAIATGRARWYSVFAMMFQVQITRPTTMTLDAALAALGLDDCDHEPVDPEITEDGRTSALILIDLPEDEATELELTDYLHRVVDGVELMAEMP